VTVTNAALGVEELARRSGVPVRTVRFYQGKGLLPPPTRVGRTARYDAEHLERLELIADLQRRGLRLSAIAQILEQHSSVPAWLGLGETLAQPWIEDRPALLTEAELLARLGDDPAELLEGLEDAGIVERRADTMPVTFLVVSPALLDISLELRDAGFDLATAGLARQLLSTRLGRLADELVAEVTERVSLGRLAEGGPAELAALIERIRPLTRRAVDVVFAHEMERALRTVVDAAETNGDT
jgi:DNA-binding transcriptional MerR regulator